MSRTSEGIYYNERIYPNLYCDGLSEMLSCIPTDGREYYWSVNYEQFYQISQLKNAEGKHPMVDYWDKNSNRLEHFLFGLPVKIDNLPEPISLQPIEPLTEKVNNYYVKRKVNPVNWND